MKIQHLAVIFIIIILPISMVISTYVNNLISVSNKQSEYDSILLNSTYDAVRAYQINTLNNEFASVSASRNRDLNASINSFFNSLATGVSSSAYTKTELNSYIPAILFTLYDGFYLYGPHENYAEITDRDIYDFKTGEKETKKIPAYKTKRSDANTEYGLKPYTYYSCEYKGNDYHLIINYTLDNYIGVCGTVDNKYITNSGYYIKPENVVVKPISDADDHIVEVSGVTLRPERLGEYQQVYDSEIISKQRINKKSYHRYYNYINYNETKYYYDDLAQEAIRKWKNNDSTDINSLEAQNSTFGFDTNNDNIKDDFIPIFAINNNKKEYIGIDFLNELAEWRGCDQSQLRDKTKFDDINYYNYYNEAQIFSRDIQPILSRIQLTKNQESGEYNEVLTESFNKVYEIETNDGVKAEEESDALKLKAHEKHNYDGKQVLDCNQPDNDPELETSDFNQHRMDVIISTVEDSLSDAIADFNVFQSNNTYSYRMPAITEDDWYKIANNVNIVSFMQGQVVGNYKYYNNYAIVTDTKNKEFISKNAIYVQDVIPATRSDNELIKRSGTIQEEAFNRVQTTLEDLYQSDNEGEKHHYPGCVKFHQTASENVIGYRLIDYDVDSFLHDYKIIDRATGTTEKETPEGGDIPVDVVKTEVINSYMQSGTGGYECIISRNNTVDWSYDELMTGEKQVARTQKQKDEVGDMNTEVRRAYISALAREKGASFKNFSMLTITTAFDKVNNPPSP